jgi:hypothetical protein
MEFCLYFDIDIVSLLLTKHLCLNRQLIIRDISFLLVKTTSIFMLTQPFVLFCCYHQKNLDNENN